MTFDVRIRLWIMMFLEFFVWGAWYVTMGTYLTKVGFPGSAVGSAYSTTSIAAIVSPFFVGLIADRFLPGQIVLGVMHLLGAGLLYYTSTITEPVLFFWVLLAYTLCYMPTLSLVNAISFHQMSDPGKEFPAIRVLGTIGWIAAGILIGQMGVEDTSKPMLIGAGVSVVLGIFSFLLPHTPAKGKGEKVNLSDLIGIRALALMKDPSFAIFTICSLLICIPLSFYYNFTNVFLNEVGVANAASKMTMGQMSEIFFMLVMPFFFARLGVKKMLLIGMLAWTVRYFLFAWGNGSELVMMLYFGIILHGICYDFFFVTGQIYVDREAPDDMRASAQGFIALITYGAGMYIGSKLSGMVVERYELKEADKIIGHVWPSIWIVPAVMAVVITILFVALFREKPRDASPAA